MAKPVERTKRTNAKRDAKSPYAKPAKHVGTKTGKYINPVDRGHYTPPVGKYARQSPQWYGPAIVGLFVLGLLTIVLNYLAVLPGSTSAWYLLVGIVIIFSGFAAMMRYH
jgi:hypothetical protein